MPDNQNDFIAAEEAVDIREFFLKLYKKKWVIISFIVLCVAFALIYSFMVQPVYKATTRIMIKSNTPRVVNFQQVTLPRYRGISYYNTQIAVLKSRNIANLVYEKIGGYEPYNKWKSRNSSKQGSFTREVRINSLLGNVKIEFIRQSQLIQIDAEHINPEIAAKIANAWANVYISHSLESQISQVQYASTWLKKEIEKAKGKVKQAEKMLQDYRKAHHIIDASSKETENITFLDQLIQRKAELEIELSQQLNYYKEKHPIMIGLKSELKLIEEKVKDEKQRLLALKEKAVQYNVLKREVETSQAFYNSLLSRLKETSSIEGLRLSNIEVVDEAKVPKSPVRPNKKTNLTFALFLGLSMGIGTSFLFESLDQSIKTPEDIQKILNLPFLGLIPNTYLKDKKTSAELIVFKDFQSPVVESYSSLRTNIAFSNPDMRKKTLVVTSAGPGQGKTTISTNLATVFAQAGEKTILIDADFRHPRLHSIFGVSRVEGITEILANNKKDFPIHSTEIPNLDLLVCGAIPPNPSELLGSKSMENFIQQLSKIYDRVIFDTPPVLAVSDAVILSTKVDTTLLIVEAGRTHKKAVIRTAEIIKSVESKIIGAVLNMAKPEKGGGYYYYHYGYPQQNKKSKS
ncbi:MAG: polysaccharide biosynthesis tyrosine autokinase [Candidatus Omnitrophica bacterium]|nr:polysaccharide biosynthesis tyrosine autokinase [Candidatus Omnitrophota bacterium]